MPGIIKSCAYCDEKSFESFTGKTKRKYKLAGNHILGKYLDKYLFHIITHVGDACKRSVTVVINKEDWENRSDEQYLNYDVSYCDIRKHDIHTKAELLEKINDPQNRFNYAAQLCASKYQELIQVNIKYQKFYEIPEEIRKIVGASLDDDILNTLLRKLGLK